MERFDCGHLTLTKNRPVTAAAAAVVALTVVVVFFRIARVWLAALVRGLHCESSVLRHGVTHSHQRTHARARPPFLALIDSFCVVLLA
jgi:hypothetical protein